MAGWLRKLLGGNRRDDRKASPLAEVCTDNSEMLERMGLQKPLCDEQDGLLGWLQGGGGKQAGPGSSPQPGRPAAAPREAAPDPRKQVEAALSEDELEAEVVSTVREQIAKLPQEDQAALYRRVAAKTSYRNQRDNDAKYAGADSRKWGYEEGGDVMCNVTSIAMALNQLGIGVDEGSQQFEDLLDQVLVEEKLGSRYDVAGQEKLAERFGADAERVWVPSFRTGNEARAWYTKEALPRLEKGAAATLSIAWGPARNWYHIVRLEWVEGDGLRIDDPFGRLYKAGSTYTYEKNDAASAEGAGARGEDGLWSWDTVAAVNRGRYVQFLTKGDAAPSA